MLKSCRPWVDLASLQSEDACSAPGVLRNSDVGSPNGEVHALPGVFEGMRC